MLNMLIVDVCARVPIDGACSLPCVFQEKKRAEFGEIGRSEAA